MRDGYSHKHMKRLFGTDGIRGVAGTFPLDPATVSYIGLALGESMSKSGKAGRVLLGCDTRESGEWIAARLLNSLVASGIGEIHNLGIITTPGLAFLTRFHQFELGIMISASHNPYRDNGIKVFSQDGFKLSDELEVELEKRIYEFIENKQPLPALDSANHFSGSQVFIEDYRSFLVHHFRGSLTSYQIGLDVCNGSAFSLAPQVFKALGAKITVINHSPDGRNINEHCGSLHLEGLTNLVERQQLDFGVAFDGDADRVLFVTSSGRVFDGDSVLYAFSRYFQQRGELKSRKVVGTVMTNFALEKALQQEGLELVRAPVGDKYVLEEMKSSGANLGGEPSGHVILRDYHTTGDGILTAVKLSEIVSAHRLSLEQLADGFRPYPQILEGLRVRKKIPIADSSEIRRAIKEAESKLAGTGRMVVRYSGTEPLLRIMAEGENLEQVKSLVSKLRLELEAIFAKQAS